MDWNSIKQIWERLLYPLFFDETYNLLSHAEAAVVASGTATLETALFKVPQIVVYKTSWINYQIAKRLVKLKYISLVNLILNRQFIPEIIQNFDRSAIESHFDRLLQNETRRDYQIGYRELKEMLDSGNTSMKLAQDIVAMIS